MKTKNFAATYFFIFLFLLTTSNSYSFDGLFQNIPIINNRASLHDFLDQCIENRKKEFIIIYKDGFFEKNENIIYYTNIPQIYTKVLLNKNGIKKVLYRISYYPGMKVADAYIKNDTSYLDNDEFELYNIAIGIVDKAKEMNNMDAEIFFHDIICRTTKYYNESHKKGIPRYSTAIGALIDRKANCQGYCDAFYMLCTMYGIKTDFQSGITKGNQRHVWNTVKINEKWYSVDVTWDDNEKIHSDYISHRYFNIPKSILKETHSWQKEFERHEISNFIDDNYYYKKTYKTNYGYFITSNKNLIKTMLENIMDNKKEIDIMTINTNDKQSSLEYIKNEIKTGLIKNKKHTMLKIIQQINGKYIYYTIFQN